MAPDDKLMQYGQDAMQNDITENEFNTYLDLIGDGRTALEVEAGTTGFVGEDCRNAGGRTYIGINCICGDFYFEPVKNDNGQISGIKIACCGDDGLDSILKALGFVMQALTDQVNEIDD